MWWGEGEDHVTPTIQSRRCLSADTSGHPALPLSPIARGSLAVVAPSGSQLKVLLRDGSLPCVTGLALTRIGHCSFYVTSGGVTSRPRVTAREFRFVLTEGCRCIVSGVIVHVARSSGVDWLGTTALFVIVG